MPVFHKCEPVFHNKNNQRDMPKVIASDLLKHVNNLKNKTFVLHGLHRAARPTCPSPQAPR